jgi:hypothetical protein
MSDDIRQQILNIAKTPDESDIEPKRLLDTLGREAVVPSLTLVNIGSYGQRLLTASPMAM